LTVHLDIDLGFFTWIIDRSVRIAGINAPELSTAEGKTARDFSMTLLPVGTKVQLRSHSLDKYGRVLGSITLPDGTDYGVAMVAAGMAVLYDGG
jgi:endonuclease YncB( thermonuclease family)